MRRSIAKLCLGPCPRDTAVPVVEIGGHSAYTVQCRKRIPVTTGCDFLTKLTLSCDLKRHSSLPRQFKMGAAASRHEQGILAFHPVRSGTGGHGPGSPGSGVS